MNEASETERSIGLVQGTTPLKVRQGRAEQEPDPHVAVASGPDAMSCSFGVSVVAEKSNASSSIHVAIVTMSHEESRLNNQKGGPEESPWVGAHIDLMASSRAACALYLHVLARSFILWLGAQCLASSKIGHILLEGHLQVIVCTSSLAQRSDGSV